MLCGDVLEWDETERVVQITARPFIEWVSPS